MKPNVFQACVIVLLLLLLALVSVLLAEIRPMRDELHTLSYVRPAADALQQDADSKATTLRMLEQARERSRKEQATAAPFHTIPDH